MEKKHSSSIKLKTFLKKNIYYIIMAICLLAIAAMITVTVLTAQKTPIDAPVDKPVDIPVEIPIDTPVDTPIDVPVVYPVVMVCPVSNGANIGNDFVIDSLVWHATLRHYAVSKGVNYLGNDGDNVMSAYSGIVKSVKYDPLNGHTVEIEHNSSLISSYSSLNIPSVVVGQSVAKGEVIGTMGVSASIDILEGPHVHFRVYENGNVINPNSLMAQGNK